MAKKTVKVFNLEGRAVGKIDLPPLFATPLRPDVIKRAVLAMQSNRIQPQGRDPMAGKRTTAESRGTGSAQARIPRLKGGTARGAFAPGTVGGREGHPPLSEKKIKKKITKKEKRLALLSAIAATASKEAVTKRGHNIEDIPQIPLVVTEEIASVQKTKDIEKTLIRLGALSEIFRVRENRKVRAGKGKSRGRKMKRSIGPLIVVSENKGLIEAVGNIPGIEAVTVSELNTEKLAPGTHPGRLTFWTSDAIEKLGHIYGQGGNE